MNGRQCLICERRETSGRWRRRL